MCLLPSDIKACNTTRKRVSLTVGVEVTNSELRNELCEGDHQEVDIEKKLKLLKQNLWKI